MVATKERPKTKAPLMCEAFARDHGRDCAIILPTLPLILVALLVASIGIVFGSTLVTLITFFCLVLLVFIFIRHDNLLFSKIVDFRILTKHAAFAWGSSKRKKFEKLTMLQWCK